jgi:hypothetical protein
MSHEEPMGVLEDDDIPYDPGITGDLMTRNF